MTQEMKTKIDIRIKYTKKIRHSENDQSSSVEDVHRRGRIPTYNIKTTMCVLYLRI